MCLNIQCVSFPFKFELFVAGLAMGVTNGSAMITLAPQGPIRHTFIALSIIMPLAIYICRLVKARIKQHIQTEFRCLQASCECIILISWSHSCVFTIAQDGQVTTPTTAIDYIQFGMYVQSNDKEFRIFCGCNSNRFVVQNFIFVDACYLLFTRR